MLGHLATARNSDSIYFDYGALTNLLHYMLMTLLLSLNAENGAMNVQLLASMWKLFFLEVLANNFRFIWELVLCSFCSQFFFEIIDCNMLVGCLYGRYSWALAKVTDAATGKPISLDFRLQQQVWPTKCNSNLRRPSSRGFFAGWTSLRTFMQ